MARKSNLISVVVLVVSLILGYAIGSGEAIKGLNELAGYNNQWLAEGHGYVALLHLRPLRRHPRCRRLGRCIQEIPREVTVVISNE